MTDSTAGCWRVDSTGYYKDKKCSVAAFSDDGSVLAIAFENILTLWDPVENSLCTTIDQGSRVADIHFCHGTEANHLAVVTEASVAIWDLFNYTGSKLLSL